MLDELDTRKMEEHPFALSFINNIVKSALRNSKLTQIGRIPRFFDPSQAQVFQNCVETWPGFFTSSWIFTRGLYLIIDNISKFLSVENCHTLIKERLNKGYDQDSVGLEFENSVVMAKYGCSRTYKVLMIRWDMSPSSYYFEQGEGDTKKISMTEYFMKTYDKKITELKQPLFEIKQKKQSIFLPPEMCILVGIPAKIRENKRIMADIRTSSMQQPHQRVESILELNRLISNSKDIQEWGIEMNLEPDEIDAKVLKRPFVFDKTHETPN